MAASSTRHQAALSSDAGSGDAWGTTAAEKDGRAAPSATAGGRDVKVGGIQPASKETSLYITPKNCASKDIYHLERSSQIISSWENRTLTECVEAVRVANVDIKNPNNISSQPNQRDFYSSHPDSSQ